MVSAPYWQQQQRWQWRNPKVVGNQQAVLGNVLHFLFLSFMFLGLVFV